MVAELSFGFWRYLCTKSYLTSLWVPVLADAFGNHPGAGDPRAVRSAVEDRIQRVHFLRNRVAHHEPVHHRHLEVDLHGIKEVAGWISTAANDWIVATSRVENVIHERP